jgi:hypothetical protein
MWAMNQFNDAMEALHGLKQNRGCEKNLALNPWYPDGKP